MRGDWEGEQQADACKIACRVEKCHTGEKMASQPRTLFPQGKQVSACSRMFFSLLYILLWENGMLIVVWLALNDLFSLSALESSVHFCDATYTFHKFSYNIPPLNSCLFPPHFR